MLAHLGSEILGLMLKEIVKHAPDIQSAILAEAEHVAASLYKYAIGEVNEEVDKLEKK